MKNLFLSLGDIELYLSLFFFAIGLAITILLKKQGKSSALVGYILFGIAAIFLLAGLLTPPDLMSNLIISIPGIIVHTIIIVIKKSGKK